MEELGHHTVDFSSLICRAAEESFLSLKDLIQKSKFPEQSDSDKKINLLKYIVRTQQRILRLNVLSKWCQQIPLIQYCQQLGSTLSSHDTCFTQAADSLFFMHEGLQQARAPLYDVPSAVEVLLTGSYERLPKCVEDMGVYTTLTEHQQRSAIKKLDVLVRSKLLGVLLPKEISEVKISDGTALVHVDGEFKSLVTLGYRGHLSMWRILHIELLVGEKSGLIKLEESRRHALGDDLERRMAGTENPFVTLYSVMHELCVALVMDTALRQVQALRQGRWKDAVRFELISDGNIGQGSNASSLQKSQDGEADWVGLRTPGLKILYWLDLDKTSSTSQSTGCPFLKIEPGQDLQIRCHHSSFVVDPLSGKEAEFSLNQGCIDMENLLLRAICCNRYTRLLEIKKDLGKNSQISRTVGGVVLHSQKLPNEDYRKKDLHNFARELEREDELRVHAYGSTFFTLGIDIRTGHFRLHSSRHVIPPFELVEYEDSLNQGSLKPTEIFISLRRKSVLCLFLSVGRFLGLQAYEHNIAAMKLPKSLLSSSDFLLMGFPDCGCSYLLLMQLDKDFRPLFFLLERGSDSSIKTHTFIDAHHVMRIKNVNVLPQNSGDIFTSSSNRKALPSVFGALSQSSGNQFQPDFAKEMSSNLSEYESKFSSLVDEVFELQRGLSGSQTIKNATSFVNASGSSNFSSMQINMAVKSGSPSPKWDGGAQTLPLNDAFRSPATGAGYTSLLHSSTNLKGMMQSSSLSALSSGSGKNAPIRKLSASKSDQDIVSIKSPHSCEVSSSISLDDAQTKLAKDSLNEAISEKWSSRLSSSPWRIGLKAAVQSTAHVTRSPPSFLAGSTSMVTSPVFEVPDSTVCPSLSLKSICRLPQSSQKRTLSDILNRIPSLHNQDLSNKKKRTMEPDVIEKCSQSLKHSSIVPETGECSCSRLVAEGSEEDASSSSHVSTFLHVLGRCTLSIKYGRLTRQMEVLGIPYSEEQGYGISSSNLWFRLPSELADPWPQLCLRLGKPGSMCWDVKINDHYFRGVWELQKGSNATPWGSYVRAASSFDVDHIRYDPEGVILIYQSVEDDSVNKMVADLRRLSSARSFALRMQKLLGPGVDEKLEESNTKGTPDMLEKLSDQARKAFKIEAVGLTSLWFSYGSNVLARFVVEWESGKECCTLHISPDQLWPHTKFLEDFINGMEVASLLDCIRLTAGPLHSLAAATRPARIGPAASGGVAALSKQGSPMPAHGLLAGNSATNAVINSAFHSAAMLSTAGRGNAGPLPSSLLPIDVSVVLRGPYWIRIMYRKQFSFDMRCFAGDQVWLQAATPPKGGPSVGGSLPCPQFRPFILDHVAQEYSISDPNPGNGGIRPSVSSTMPRSANQAMAGTASRLGSSTLAGPSNTASISTRRSITTGIPLHMRGEMNTASIGLGDDGGYGGGWVPHYALKKVLRGALRYLGVLWLFAQLPDILKETLGSVLKDNEGALLNLDQEQPALRFFIGGYVFAVSVHRLQLLLQVLSVKRFHHSVHQQFPQSEPQEELTQPETSEMCDYFSRRVASEPYNTSRVASFITLLTLPISVLREFLKLIAWKKTSQLPSTDPSPVPKPHIELSLESHSGAPTGPSLPGSRSSINYDRANSSVDFGLTVVLDPTHMHHINAAGGAAWLPFCVLVRLRYSFGESPSVSFLGMEGSHGGRACWQRHDEWESCKQRVEQSVEVMAGGDPGQGRLKLAADNVQKTLQFCLNGLAE